MFFLSTIVSLFLVGCASFSGQEREINSPFPPSAPGFTIPNAHFLSKKQGTLYRGQSPHGKINELKKAGVTQILVFKEGTPKSLEKLYAEFQNGGYTNSQIHQIPFRWKNLESLKTSCEQTIDALALLTAAWNKQGETLYFHCTAGEDRTGYLAGLFRMLAEGWTREKAFQQEMCVRGYGWGDPEKPKFVSEKIDTDLTPLFLQMASFIEQKRLTLKSLNKAVCANIQTLPPIPDRFKCTPQKISKAS